MNDIIFHKNLNALERPRSAGVKPLFRLLAAFLSIVFAGAVSAAVPAGFSIDTVATGLYSPVSFDFGPGNRIFVAEKLGRVRVVVNGRTQPTPFLDISPRVNTYNDRGLTAIAVDPDFPTKPYIYVAYVYDPPETASNGNLAGPDQGGSRVSRVSRFTASATNDYNVAVPNSEVVLIGKNGVWSNIPNPNQDWRGALTCERAGQPIQDCIPLDEHSHTVGTLKFGSDGTLYASVGDASRSGDVGKYPSIRAQRLDFLIGKILRVDPNTGQGLSDNPFFDGNPNSNRSKIWHYGLRNPFRFAIKKSDNAIFVGNVGWENWEEIDTGPPGSNFGWPCYEGGNGTLEVHAQHQNHATCQTLYSNPSSVVAPLFGYQKLNGVSVSIILGDFLDNNRWPSNYRGGLFFGDFNRQVVEYVTFDAAGNVNGRNNFGTGFGGLTQLSQGPDQDLYYTVIDQGEIRAIRYQAGDPPPTAAFSVSRLTGPAPLLVHFDASGSSDPDNDPLNYRWNFGDGANGSGKILNHTFNGDGAFNVSLTVSDAAGGSDVARERIVVGNKAPNLGFGSGSENTVRNTRYRIDEIVAITGWGNDPEDGTLSGSSLRWNAVLHHNEHAHPDFTSGTGTTLYIPYPDHGENTHVQICLTVSDSSRLTNKKCINAYPREVKLTIDSQPRGLPIDYAGVTQITPFEVTSVSGGRRNITAPLWTEDNRPFLRWSDDGAAAHTIIVPDSPQRFTVYYGAAQPAIDSDGDGLSDDDERRWGTDPSRKERDRDNDGTIDVVDSRPNDRQESGAAVLLEVGVVDTDRYGFAYAGKRDHRSVLRAAFPNPGDDVLVEVVGWDIDSANELGVWISPNARGFQWLGFLKSGRNRKHARRSYFYVPKSMMGPGRNWIEIRQRRKGEPWGITGLVVKKRETPPARPLKLNTLYRARQGFGFGVTNHRYVLPHRFNRINADLDLEFEAFDIDTNREASVILNGRRIAYLRRSGNNKIGARQRVRIKKSLLKRQNRLEILQHLPPDEVWGVRNIRLKRATSG